MIQPIYEEYHDTITDMDFDLPNYSLEGYETLEDFYYDNRINVFSIIFNCLEFAISNNLTQIPCFFLNGNLMIIKSDMYEDKLNECLTAFEVDEMYEQCTCVIKLKEMICK